MSKTRGEIAYIFDSCLFLCAVGRQLGKIIFYRVGFKNLFELSLSLDKNKIGCPIEFVPNPRGLRLKQTYNFMDVHLSSF